MNSGFTPLKEEFSTIDSWVSRLGHSDKTFARIISSRQGWGQLCFEKSIIGEALHIGEKKMAWGFGTHADSEIVIRFNRPIKTFRSYVGAERNRYSINGVSKMVFSVFSGGKLLAETQPLDVHSHPQLLEVFAEGATELILTVKAVNTTDYGHAVWGEPEVVTSTGDTLQLGKSDMLTQSCSMPLSFTYNGMDSERWFAMWGIVHTSSDEKDCIVHKYVCCDTDTGLQCTTVLREYKKIPACLWNVSFSNVGKAVTPILENVKTLAISWPASQRKILQRAKGAFHYAGKQLCGESFRDNFMLSEVDISMVSETTMGGFEGRPSVDWMPYFNFIGQDEGLTFGIGWTGQWQAKISGAESYVNFQAGMEFLRTVLEPGESISQPSILMIYWQGADSIRGNNLLRRFISDVLLPRDSSGVTLQAPACNPSWGGMIASNHIARIKNMIEQKIPADYYWIDAGWYGKAGPNASEFTSDWSMQAGDWSINRETYPNGFREISDLLHKNGKKFLLWFEPERAICGTPVTEEHPDWFLGQRMKGQDLALNLGNPNAWKWCVELISGMIKEQGIDCYRQDFNYSPLPFWKSNDTPDRMGITEIRHIEGLYAFLDELRRRFPDLLIDNCASGGRRLDFEMMRRSIPLWASDMQCFPDYTTERNLQQIQGLSMWIPQFAVGTQGRDGDTYHFRSAMAAGINAHLFSYEKEKINPGYPYEWLRERLEEYHKAKLCFSGDFYPMMPQSSLFTDWSAYQFDRPDLGYGFLEAFRKPQSPIEKIRCNLQGLDAAATYEIQDTDEKSVVKTSGKDLMEKGWPVEIANKRGCKLYFYKKVSQ